MLVGRLRAVYVYTPDLSRLCRQRCTGIHPGRSAFSGSPSQISRSRSSLFNPEAILVRLTSVVLLKSLTATFPKLRHAAAYTPHAPVSIYTHSRVSGGQSMGKVARSFRRVPSVVDSTIRPRSPAS